LSRWSKRAAPDPASHPAQRMIPKKPVPDLIRDVQRFSEEIMRHQ
jgi:hypothetical protein